MEIKAPRETLAKQYPVRYMLAFDVTQWVHGGNSELPYLCDRTTTPWTFSYVGFLLWQHGVVPDDLCVKENAPGVRYRTHLYPARYLYDFPKEMHWWADKVVPAEIFDLIAGDMYIKQFPDLSLPDGTEVSYHTLIEGVNDTPWGVTREGKRAKLDLNWRAFWLREITRIGGQIGIQFHSPRTKVKEPKQTGSR